MIEVSELEYIRDLEEYADWREHYPKRKDRMLSFSVADYPVKCYECLKQINFCRFWQKSFKCEGIEESKLVLERL